jgi:ferredoxin-fold anticodon binding domain-containing protein
MEEISHYCVNRWLKAAVDPEVIDIVAVISEDVDLDAIWVRLTKYVHLHSLLPTLPWPNALVNAHLL